MKIRIAKVFAAAAILLARTGTSCPAQQFAFEKFTPGPGFARGILPNEIEFTFSDPKAMSECVCNDSTGRAFTISVTTYWHSGSEDEPFGITLYRTADGSDKYLFWLTASGKIHLSRYTRQAGWQNLFQADRSDIVGKLVNFPKVTSDGAAIKCYLSDILICSYSPNDRLPEQTFAGVSAGSISMTFKDFRISAQGEAPETDEAQGAPELTQGSDGTIEDSYRYALDRARSFDYNGDGIISMRELNRSPEALKLLDRDRDGHLSVYELADGLYKKLVKISNGELIALEGN